METVSLLNAIHPVIYVFGAVLLVALLVVEAADVVFADSIPAVLAVTTDPFLVYTSAIAAVLAVVAVASLRQRACRARTSSR
jgi:predicted tellurium resistance membrane protein TerC